MLAAPFVYSNSYEGEDINACSLDDLHSMKEEKKRTKSLEGSEISSLILSSLTGLS